VCPWDQKDDDVGIRRADLRRDLSNDGHGDVISFKAAAHDSREGAAETRVAGTARRPDFVDECLGVSRSSGLAKHGDSA
jgi:hypothetical protein